MRKGRFKVDDFIKQHDHTHYCEAIVHTNEDLEYAIPSHIEKIRDIANLTIEEARVAIPIDESPICWFLDKTGCIALWYDAILAPEHTPITDEQRETIRKLCECKIIDFNI